MSHLFVLDSSDIFVHSRGEMALDEYEDEVKW